MVDKSLKHIDLYMTYPDLSKIPNFPLPAGYSFRLYKPGDEDNWAEIEVSAEELPDIKAALHKFSEYYGKDLEKLETRCLFLLNSDGETIGTATGFYNREGWDDKLTGNLDWVAIKREYQGLGLSKPLITEAMKVMRGHGHKGAFLHTQTTTWLACKIYMDLGWEPFEFDKSEFEEGWAIVRNKIAQQAQG